MAPTSSSSGEKSSSFQSFALAEPLPQILTELGFETPTPVQRKGIPVVLENRDLLATAQTGTGKTAAFVLPLISKMLNGWKKSVLVVAPTRELAEQIGAVIEQMTSLTPELRTAVIIGGASYPKQIRSLRNQPAFVVGTPGRLIDQTKLGHLQLSGMGALVIDEADRLLDMGFEPQMNEIVDNMPKDRQTLLFSATLPEEIIRLASSYLTNPVRVSVGAASKPIEKIAQDMIRVTTAQKDDTLLREIDKATGSIIIFAKTKWKTEKLASFLGSVGHYVARIHGDRSQAQRSAAIAEFRDGKARILVATDIAARGIDIPHIGHVINYDLPVCPEDYIHRIGRTARAGANGHSIAFVTPEETMRWAQIHKLIYGFYPPDSNGKRLGRETRADGSPRAEQRPWRGGKPEKQRPVAPPRTNKYKAEGPAAPRATKPREQAAPAAGPRMSKYRQETRGEIPSYNDKPGFRKADPSASRPSAARPSRFTPSAKHAAGPGRKYAAATRAEYAGPSTRTTRGDAHPSRPTRGDSRPGAARAGAPRSFAPRGDSRPSVARDGVRSFAPRGDSRPARGDARPSAPNRRGAGDAEDLKKTGPSKRSPNRTNKFQDKPGRY